MKDYVIVVSANFKKAYPIIRSLSIRGLNVIGAFYYWRSNAFSKFLYKRFKISNPYMCPQKYLLELISLTKLFKPRVIIPVGFIDTLVISKYREHFPENVMIPIPAYEAIVKVSNKLELPKLCVKLKIKCPKTVKASSKDIVFIPGVVKGVSDASSPKYFFFKENIWSTLKGVKENLILQEFIPGFGVGYFVFAINGKPLLEFCHRRILETKPGGGASIVACKYFDPRAYVYGRRIVRFLKWTGVLMVEFRKHIETGELYLMEINPKFWGSLELPVSLGYDFPTALIEYLVYGKKPELKVQLKRECFSWVLSGLHYLKENPKVWFRILKYGINGFPKHLDVHLDDPAEFLYSLITRFISTIFSERKISSLYLKNIKTFLRTLMKNKVETLILDLDGTLVKLNINWNDVRKKLIGKGLLKPWQSISEALYSSFHTDKKLFRTISNIVEVYEEESVKYVKPNASITGLLKALAEENVKLGLVTKQTVSVGVKVLEKLRVLKYFNVIIGRDVEFDRVKQLIQAMKRLDVNVENTFFIGDTLLDAYSAAKVEITPIIVTNNPYRFMQMLEYGVPVFTKIEEPLKIVLRRRSLK